jgi:hypothetical protein
MAMPSSMAMVLNSAAKQPCASMIFFTCCRFPDLILAHSVGAP